MKSDNEKIPAYNEISIKSKVQNGKRISNCAIQGGIMKVFHVKKQLAALFMPGFLIGIIYVNFLAKKYVAAPDLFSEYFLDQFRGVQIDEKEYLWYLLRIRCVPFFMLSGLALTKLKKVSAGLFLGWTGISVGVLVSLAASNLGMKGCLLCLIGVSPQFLFYIPAYFMILKYCNESEDGRWNRQKTIFVGLMMSLGIITELYVNPVLVKLFLNYV